MVSQFVWRKDFLLHGTYLWKTLQILTYVFDWLYFTKCLTSFSSINHLLGLCAQFLILFHLTWMRFSWSTHMLMFLSLETLTTIWLTYFDGTDRPGELCYSFFISNHLTQIVNFPTQILDCDSHSPALLNLVFLMLCWYLFYNGFPSIEKFWSCCCLSFHWLSIKFTTGCPVSSQSLWLFLCRLGRSLWSFEICSMGWYL